MRTISVQLRDLPKVQLRIGYEGEQNHTRVIIDCKEIFDDYPNAAATMVAQPPVGDLYPVILTRDGDRVIWNVARGDVANEGSGSLQLTFTDGSGDAAEIIKTEYGSYYAKASLTATGDAPASIDDWLEDAQQTLSDLEAFDNMTATATTLEAGESATAEMRKVLGHKDILIGIPKGDKGDTGTAGADGKDGAPGKDGADGKDGKDGKDGSDGADGYSPTASVSKSGSTATITITDKNGTTTAQISDGESGASAIDDTSTAADKVWSAQKVNAECSSLLSALNEIWLHKIYTNTSGTGSADIYFPGKAGQILRIITDSVAVNINTRATATGSNIQTQFVAANTSYDLTITTDFNWLHLYYTSNGTTNFYIVDTVLTKAVDDIEDIKEDIELLASEDTKIHEEINNHESIINANVMGIDVQENLYPGAADWSGEWTASNPSSISLSNELFDGYPVMYYSGTWRKYYKTIPIVSGKTYTFEAWMKHTTAGTAAIYAKDGDTQNPATISVSSKTYQNTPANTWVKLSLTFVCTESGNITPYVHSRSGNMYFAKYYLCEGEKAFSLKNELNDRATKNDISGIGDYKKYEFFKDSITQNYWNPEIVGNIPSGTKCKLIFNSYSGSYLGYVRVDGKKGDGTYTNGLAQLNTPTKGSEAEFITSEDYVALRIQYYVTSTESNVTSSVYLTTNKMLGIANELLSMSKRRVFHICKDGTGDFTSFVNGINEACKYMDSIVYVGAGTYDLLDELGSDYIKQAGVSERKGLVLKNRVHVICSSQTILSMTNLRSLYDSDEQYNNAREYLSPINTGVYGCTLENATIIDSNVRYSIHDDQGWSGSTPYTNKFINCTLIHKSGMYGDCIGGGLGENCDIEIRGCYLEGESNVVRLAYYHGNNHTGVTTAKGRVIVCDNYFAGVGTFQMTNYGDSAETSVAYVSNNSFGTAPSISNEGTTVDMKAWNNEVRSN